MIRILYIFLFLFIFQNVSNLVGNTFIISTGHARINMINIIVFGILNLLLDILLVRHYGYMGIAYAKLLVVILGSLSLIILYRHALKKRLGRKLTAPYSLRTSSGGAVRQPGKEIRIGLCHAPPGKVIQDPGATSLAPFGSGPSGIFHHFPKRRQKGIRLIEIKEPARLSVTDDRIIAGDTAGDDRQAAGHGLQDHVGHPFTEGGIDETIGAPVDLPETALVHPSMPDQTILDPHVFCMVFAVHHAAVRLRRGAGQKARLRNVSGRQYDRRGKRDFSQSENDPQKEMQRDDAPHRRRFAEGQKKSVSTPLGITCTGQGSTRSDISFKPGELATTATLFRKMSRRSGASSLCKGSRAASLPGTSPPRSEIT